MTTPGANGRTAWSARSIALYLLGTAGLSASLTLVFFGMRAVMDIGGACADGGPFVSAQPCPEGTPLLMVGGIFGLFGFGALMLWSGMSLGARYGCLVALAWPALFLSLGWNFLEYGLRPPDGSGELVIGWLIPGVLFVLMGGGPLVAMLPLGRGAVSLERQRRLATLATRGAPGAAATTAHAPGAIERPAAPDDADLVSQLERLAALRERGSLTDAEFEAAKGRLLATEDTR